MTPADFKAAFPEFGDVEAAIIQRAINASLPYLDPIVLEDLLPDCLGNFVAHRIVMDQQRQVTGPSARAGDVISKSAAGMSMSRDGAAVLIQQRDQFMRTIYGQEYRRLSRLMGKGAQAV